jgi:hypothetical protein
MRHKYIKAILLFFAFILFANMVFADGLLITAPGQGFTPGVGVTGSPFTQISGVPFYVTVYSVNASLQPYGNSASVTMTSNGSPATTFTPNPIGLNNSVGSTTGCAGNGFVTINTIATGNVGLYASATGGWIPGSVTVSAQYLQSFTFNNIASVTAGQPVVLTITAMDNTNATVTSFNGTAALTAVYPSSADNVNLGNITFVNGVATVSVTLYKAVSGTVKFQVVSTAPSVTSNGNNFIVSGAAFTKLLITGPGQTIVPGTNGGSGRNTDTMSVQTAGVPFGLTVYAVDAFWNVTTTAAGSVTLSATDLNATFDGNGTKTIASGVAQFAATFKDVGVSRSQTITATTSAGATASAAVVPMTYNSTLSSFTFPNQITSRTAGAGFSVGAVAVDAYGNTILNYSGTPSLAVSAGGTAISTNYWTAGSISFVNGVGTIGVNIFQTLVNTTLVLTDGTAVGTSNVFSVNNNILNKILIIAPGQTYDHGNKINFGFSGSATAITAGTPATFSVYATDHWGNRVSGNSDNVSITASTDPLASIGGALLPQVVTLSAGGATFNMTLATAGSQVITATDMTNSISAGSVTVPVLAETIDHFDITGLSGTYTAGVTTTATVIAKDKFGNKVANYGGEIYISSPNTDYTLPAQTTMAVSDSLAGLYNQKWAVTFTAGTDGGQRLLHFTFDRAATGIQLFASTVYSDTPTASTGNTGTSQAFTVVPNTGNRLQVIPPGVTPRPGTVAGEINVPTGQSNGITFTTGVNYCDMWWNIVTTANDVVQVTTYDPANAKVNGSSTQPVSKLLTNGSATFTIQYNVDSNVFNVSASDQTNPSFIQADTSQNIQIFTIKLLNITNLTGGVIDSQIVGQPFAVSITAYSDLLGHIATGFNGTVQLRASNNYSDSEFCINQTVSPSFVNGVCVIPNIIMYRSSTTGVGGGIGGGTGGGVQLSAQFGSGTPSTSNTFQLWPGAPTQLMMLVTGMSYRPGLTILGDPNYHGYTGSPSVAEAGSALDFQVLLVDDNYNIVYSAPTTGNLISLSSTDAAATVTEGQLPQGAIQLTNGQYVKTLTLFTVNTGIQHITATHQSPSITSITSPAISIKHHDAIHDNSGHFTVSAPSGNIVAGVPFNILVVARDAYGNTLDNLNGGIPYNNNANISANYSGATNTLYPTTCTLNNGQVVSSIQVFKAPGNPQISASAGTWVTQSPPAVNIVPNVFSRLYLSTVNMDPNGNGIFLGTTPSVFPINVSNPSDRSVNDAGHPSSTYPFTVSSCDAYGNATLTADTLGQTITVTTNDPHAAAIGPIFIQPGNISSTFDVEFHTAMHGVTVGATISNTAITGYQTLSFTTTPGDMYGLQELIPGITYDAGAGTVNVISGTTFWSNGLSGTAFHELAGVPFPLTIQACDIYGNFVSGNSSDTVTLGSTDSDPSHQAYPSTHNPIILQLNDSVANTVAALGQNELPQIMTMTYKDNNPLYQPNLATEVQVFITNSGQLYFETFVNGVRYADGTTRTQASAAPQTFNLSVEVLDAANNTYNPVPVRISKRFSLTPVSLSGQPLGGIFTPTGILNAVNGEFSYPASYNQAGSFRIRIKNEDTGMLDPLNQDSCIIDMGANTLNVNLTVQASPQNVRSGSISNIIASLLDLNGNPVSNGQVLFTVKSGNSIFPTGLTFTAQSDSNGRATAPLTAALLNESDVIEAKYNTLTADVTINTSLVDPIAGQVSNYPNPFKAGVEKTTIAYLLVEPTDVTVKIYTLMGDLVTSKSFRQGSPGAVANSMNVFLWDGKNDKGDTVGNGGYICAVDAVINGAKKKMIRKIAVLK